jgi:hypothetical protein
MKAARILADEKREKRPNTPRPKVKVEPIQKFPYTPLTAQIERLFAQPGFAESIEHWRNIPDTAPDELRDVYTGRVWKQFLTKSMEELEWRPDEEDDAAERKAKVPKTKPDGFLATPHNLAFQLNFDGFQPMKRSHRTLDGFYAVCLNLPPHLRYGNHAALMSLLLIPCALCRGV